MPSYPYKSFEGLNFTEHVIEIPFGEGKTLELRTGKLAKQANATIIAKCGECTALVAVVMSDYDKDGDFFPLLVDYREKFYAGGRIPGGFLKREARPSDGEVLRARLIDRTIRPMFPDGFRRDVQVYITILSTDKESPTEMIAMCAASAALHISDIPFSKPIAGVRIGRVEDKSIVNPNNLEIEAGDIDLIVAGHVDGINMVECGASEVSEEALVDALELAHDNIKVICAGIDLFRTKTGKEKMEFAEKQLDLELLTAVKKLIPPHIKDIQETHEKKARDTRLALAVSEIQEALAEEFPDRASEIASIIHLIDDKQMRNRCIKEGIRADGRRTTEIRPIWSEIDVLPTVHGSSVFTRGQTQALSITTLGAGDERQMIDDMTGVSFKHFLLHYNFPSYSVGEARPPRGPGRREIGHGALAERAITAVLPSHQEFPYTIRSVVEILESNGSSSMATICSTSMSLMDAGVPLKAPVAGVAMGLVSNDSGELAILTDIQGIEDHAGDMDFKVAGTETGVTALQMDIKLEGIGRDVLARALDQAKDARLFILKKMNETITSHRAEFKPQVPRIISISINPDKIREVIGTGGRVIRSIVEESGAKVDINDDGTIHIMSENAEASQKALDMINSIVREFEPGETIVGKVVKIIEHGAIVSIGGGKDGMIHVSELEHHRVNSVEDVLKEGEEVTVKILEVDKERGRIRLSRKALLPRPEGSPAPAEGGEGGEQRAPRRDDRGSERRRRPRPARD